jgi:hypothetical protein
MSKIEVNAIEPQCGTTLTIGASDTSIAGIGTVNWDTTAKTSAFTAVSGRGYFVDTTSGAITVTLPASPSAGDIVAVSDYTGTFESNNLTIGRNGSNIRGSALNLVLNINNQTITLIYVDATEGWNVIQESNNLNNFVSATGGTITCDGDFKVHTFTGPGTFTVTNAGSPLGSTTVDYLVVAGGGASSDTGCAADGTGGGGAGGYRTNYPSPAVAGLAVTIQGYPITVGAGGATGPMAPYPNPSFSGTNSIFSTITATGGGGAGGYGTTTADPAGTISLGMPGGSGGGGRGAAATGGTGNTPPVSPPQGNPGGIGAASDTGGGGGGATAAGVDGNNPCGVFTGGPGGTGATNLISGSSTAYAGGGGGSGQCIGGTGGPGGGGIGGQSTGPTAAGTVGGINTGGGGGGAQAFSPGTSPTPFPGNTGGSGIVIIRYKFQ